MPAVAPIERLCAARADELVLSRLETAGEVIGVLEGLAPRLCVAVGDADEAGEAEAVRLIVGVLNGLVDNVGVTLMGAEVLCVL